jgi:hypothetical protein
MRDMQLNVNFPLRWCLVNGEKMLFHMWGIGRNGQTEGLVEDIDGSITTVFPYEIRFTDEIFKEYMNEEGDGNA